jgi:hypothetical protein
MNNNDFYDSFFERDESTMKAFGLAAADWASFSALFTGLAAWVTHVVVCIKTTSWILLVFGIIVPPIGLIHGIGTWFGWFV